MKEESIAGLRLYYDAEEQDAAQLVGRACERSVALFQERWGLETPEDCRVYVMTSWMGFLLQSTPWPWKGYVILTLPLVALRAGTIWPYAGGWAIQYGKRRVVGVKPPRLIQEGNRSLGEKIFTKNRDLSETVETVTCHELVHAFTFHLKLPTWLHEGLATLAMEHYLGRDIVRRDSLDSLLRRVPIQADGLSEKQHGLLARYARGYWLTRLIEETNPKVLRELLSRRYEPQEMQEQVASAFGKDPESFWSNIDMVLRGHFR